MIAGELVVVVEAVEEDCSCYVQTLLAVIFDRKTQRSINGATVGEEEGKLEVMGDTVCKLAYGGRVGCTEVLGKVSRFWGLVEDICECKIREMVGGNAEEFAVKEGGKFLLVFYGLVVVHHWGCESIWNHLALELHLFWSAFAVDCGRRRGRSVRLCTRCKSRRWA